MPRRYRLVLASVATVAAVLGIAGISALAVTSRQSRPLRVLLLGDSLAWEARDTFIQAVTAHHRAVVQTLLLGGTDFCTWQHNLPATMKTFKPQVAVVEFAGNAFGPCMADPTTGKPLDGPALVTKYQADGASTIRFFLNRDVTVYLVDTPVTESPYGDAAGIARAQAALASLPGVRADNAAGAVEAGGRYVSYLPCLAAKPCLDRDPATGRPADRVRSLDGAHFCPDNGQPVAGVPNSCNRWSGGAYRYGAAMAAPIIRDFRL